MIKQLALQIINELPDNVDMAQIIEALYIRIKVEKGLQDVKNGNIISHEQLKKEMTEW